MENKPDKIQYADDDTTPTKRLLEMRLPSLIIGLILGIILSIITSKFEKVLLENVKIAFFIPLIVYMADAVGTQTQNIYVRDLGKGAVHFHKYLVKETLLGIFLGLLSSTLTFTTIIFMFNSLELALAVSLGMFVAVAVAPLIALAVARLLQLEHSDPAVGAGPIATVIQDTVSIVVYGIVATLIIL